MTESKPSLNTNQILVTGATGYIGGRLARELIGQGRSVRVMARRPERVTIEGAEIVAGDVLKPSSLRPALDGIDTAYYLIHSMASSGAFEEQDRIAARNFARAAQQANVGKIIYLGGLGHGSHLSRHLSSRQEVGKTLRESRVPTVELRASIVIGSGSLSFELVRALTEKLPVMVTPKWVRIAAQPIAVADVVTYLVAAADVALDSSRTYEIGGPDRISYGGLMREYARQRRLRRVMIPVPFLSPRVSSLWLELVTPVHARVGKKLISGLRNATVVRDTSALRDLPVKPVGVSKAIAAALREDREHLVGTRWSDAASMRGDVTLAASEAQQKLLIDTQAKTVGVAPHVAFAPIKRIGGKTGWYYADSLWKLRGYMDSLIGGVGLRRGRKDHTELQVGDKLDFWRVEAFEPDARLLLRAEMRLPGQAWLQFEVTGDENESTIRQTAIFEPLGVSGRLYWYCLYPAHHLIFNGMLDRIALNSLSATETASSDR